MKRVLLLMMAVFVLCLGGCKEQKEVINPDTKVEETDKTDVEEPVLEEYVLYYTDAQAEKLYPITREATKENASDPLFVMRELMKLGGSEDGKLINVIPSNVCLNSCKLDDGVCTVDLSAEFIGIEGTATQKIAVYSVVNTLCAIDGVDCVQFIIDGEKVDVFGNYLFDEPFEADMSLVEE